VGAHEILDRAVFDEEPIAAIGDLRRARQRHFVVCVEAPVAAEADAAGGEDAPEWDITRGPFWPQAAIVIAIRQGPNVNAARFRTPTLDDRAPIIRFYRP